MGERCNLLPDAWPKAGHACEPASAGPRPDPRRKVRMAELTGFDISHAPTRFQGKATIQC